MGGEQYREIERLEERIKELEADRERLDWLIANIDVPFLSNVKGSDRCNLVRQAIDEAMGAPSRDLSIRF